MTEAKSFDLPHDVALRGPGATATTAADHLPRLADADRLAVLERTGLLDSPTEAPYDRIARLAARVMATPIATVTLIDADRQFYKACVGLPEPLSTTRETTLEYSFCKHTVSVGLPLVIPDTRADERVAHIPSVTDYGVRAYAGVPLLVDGQAIGTLCVMDMEPRAWTEDAVALLVDLAAAVTTEIQLRLTVQELEATSAAAVEARGHAERGKREMSEFLAMMSHDLRTPLNAIGGYRQLLELGVHGPLSDGQRTTLARIKRVQEHLLNLITEVLTFARADAGTETYRYSDVPVDETLRGLEALVRPQLEAKRLSYGYDGAGSDAKMHVDVGRLSRIVVNLLTNAIKFTPGSGSVTLSWFPAGDRIVIRVRDTGIGIPPDLLESIFNPFVQVSGQKAMNPDGVGLGLAIGRRLSRGMKGDLTASNATGGGALFELTVPRASQ